MKKSIITLISTVALCSVALFSFANEIATLRDNTSIETQKTPDKMPDVTNTDIKKSRAYPMQPPLIPHKVRNYQVDLKANTCMSCHSRKRTEESQAPMVSVTHYMDRDGNFLAEVSPRRYFCNQCHVPQLDAKPLVENTFVDMDTMMKEKQANQDENE
ncbi:nitrate reductase cytochrome c-type subunit [Thalassotalea crassostreae]|uniref:nitrate reductase cytochrome c-type subunit n=1 Tax=Thalassotalea crassostreae TaxID=1763536 RepID=UPI00083905C3|nr:nitrate reductase cytochrome c-type subunit [Thalassotalea crassostreae]